MRKHDGPDRLIPFRAQLLILVSRRGFEPQSAASKDDGLPGYSAARVRASAASLALAFNNSMPTMRLVTVDRDGTARRNPWLMVKSKAVEQLQRIASEFGFSPASWPRIGRAALPGGRGAQGEPGALDKFLASRPDPTHGMSLEEFLATHPDHPSNQKRQRSKH